MGHHRLATPDLDRVFRGETVLGLSEWELLERYLERRDEVAFEALVARHGPMVLGVCRRMLDNRTDVDDAFQATFLVLVRRARHLGPRDAIGPWLHGVATRVALRARCEAARRRRLQPITADFAAVNDDRSTATREIGEAIDDELARLPSKYRHPIVLCYLEGQTHEEAARQLNWPIGTVKGRLSRARTLLQSRLVRRGLAPTVAVLSAVLAPESSAALHHELLDRTVSTSLKLALGHATAQIVSPSIMSLVEGVLTTMFLNTLKWAGVAALVCGLAFTGIGVMARQDSKAKVEAAPADLKDHPVRQATTAVPSLAAPNTDAQDGPVKLPELYRALFTAAAQEWEQAYKELVRTNNGLERTYQASKRLMDARLAALKWPDENVAAAAEHFDRIRAIARAQHGVSSTSDVESAQLKAYAAEAGLWLAQAKAGGAAKPKESASSGGINEGRGKDPQSQRIHSKLDDRLTFSFAQDTTIEDVLKYIKEMTKSSELPTGIPIYVDPLGLQEAEKTMASVVTINLEGVPLRRTLQLILKQLGLIYFIDDGMIYITTPDSGDELGPPMREPSPLKLKLEKAERGELTMQEMEEFVKFLKTRQEIMKLSEDPEPPKGGGRMQ
jgi:RNA polymerase sigma factor (sigma-70 family)